MEELVHWMMSYVMNAQELIIKVPLEFARPMTLLECSGYADAHREAVSVYNEELNRWIMNDGSGTWFGHQCYQDPNKMFMVPHNIK